MDSKKLKVLFFEKFAQAKTSKEEIKAKCKNCEQLNVVILQEGNMDDEELLGIDPKVKIFAGTAWNTIHRRRVDEGYYQD